MPRWIPSGEPPPKKKVVSFVVKQATNPELVEWLHALPHGEGSDMIRTILDQVAKTGRYSPEVDAVTSQASRPAIQRQQLPATSVAQRPVLDADRPTTPAVVEPRPEPAPLPAVEIKPIQEAIEVLETPGSLDAKAAQVLQDLADMC